MEEVNARRPNGFPKSYAKWGIDVVRSGYTLIPNHLIGINLYLSKKCKLNATEQMAILVIISNWWDPERFPAASKSYIAERLNISSRQVQRVIKSLESKGALKRVDGGNSTGGANAYDIRNLLNLISAITNYRDGALPQNHDSQLEFDFDLDARLRMMRAPEWSDDDVPF